jgi:ribosomal protein S18 acetylase RimI-like enzyme
MISVPTLEAAAFAAWPSERTLDLRGWLLRLDRGHTKRANSANATAGGRPLRDIDIDAIEDHFRRHGLTPTFRLPGGLPTPRAARDDDERLARRGYRLCDASLVMTRPLSPADVAADPAQSADATAWLRAFGDVTGRTGADQAAHRDILLRIAHPCAWAVQGDDGRPTCCGLGVRVDRLVGLFDIATRAGRQRRGEARRLCRALMAWGARRGADTAFLQVLATNRAALGLYESLGFRVAYAYHYRVPPA